jgi:metal-responsive CopG/Arc/MetJ family transcriptional regulator
MVRQDHLYVNLPKSLLEAVDSCVSNIILNNTRVYKSRKEFVIKAIQNHIELEKSKQKIILEVKQVIRKNSKTTTTKGGNRPKNV